MLSTSPETVCYIIVKAREFGEQVAPSDSDPETESNPSDDRGVGVLESRSDEPTYRELLAALRALNVDQQLDLMALAWLGRADFDTFEEARAQAETFENPHFARYLAGTPRLGDFLKEGLAALGYSCAEFERRHL